MPVTASGLTTAKLLFGETLVRLLIEIAPEHVPAAEKTGPIDQLKPLWKDGLTNYY